MGRPCNTCQSPNRDAIEAALVSGEPAARVARRYSISVDSVTRHKAHISPALIRASIKREEQEEKRAASLLDRIEELYDEARSVLEDAKADRKGAISINAIREMRSTLELIGRLTGELRDAPTAVINVMASPDWLIVREAMFEVLARHPAVQAEVSTRLLELEAPPGRTQEGA